MRRALELAKMAEQAGEVPVGALVVIDNEIIAEGFNRPISEHDPTAHAEIVAMRIASKKIGNYRLLNSTIYVTLEPCVMCIGAMMHARIKRLVYAAKDPKTGAVHSKFNLLEKGLFNHQMECDSSILAEESSSLLRNFFQARRG
ncbi:MAG: tRNA adenosine(34) deaminase TadA [Gammaproteobacteria bacterium]|nr:tRNA adenosine(34) deaminase TadA [Gammaproteobacteria bacterium]